MATNIIQTFNFLSVQTGNGAPNHISNKPTLYFDKDSDLIYLTSDGAGNWVYLLDSSTPITGGTNTFVTGFTYSNNNLSLYRNDNVILTVNASVFTGLTINGVLSATTYQNLPIDVRVTGGTYSNGTAIFTNNTGGTFNVSGLFTGNTDIQVTAFTYSNNIITLSQTSTPTKQVIINIMSGLTVNGILSATTYSGLPVEIQIACSDLTTALTTGSTKAYFRSPYDFTLTEVRASLLVAQTSGNTLTVDINKSGTTVLSTKLTVDNSEKTSLTALTPPVISTASIASDDEITFDIDIVGSSADAKGLIVTLIGRR